jgi:hypothetical protein
MCYTVKILIALIPAVIEKHKEICKISGWAGLTHEGFQSGAATNDESDVDIWLASALEYLCI